MSGGARDNRRLAGAAALLLAVCATLACATMGTPPGGPEDETSPTFGSAVPDSGTVGLDPFDRIVIEFSEKVTPKPAERILRFYPPLEVRKSGWHSRQRLTVEFEQPVPADTVLIIEISRGLEDVHRIRSFSSYRYPVATADSLPVGEISGRLLQKGEPLSGAVVELYDVPPDTVDLLMQEVLRRAETDSSGRFVFKWLPTPGGPWLLRAFDDRNGDLRPADNEGRRLFAASVELTNLTRRVELDPLTVFTVDEPGSLRCGPPVVGPWTGAEILAWPLVVAEEDSGWSPQYSQRSPRGLTAVSAVDSTDITPAGPGDMRVIVFVDVDADSLLGALPDSSAWPDTLTWVWEPHVVAEGFTVPPGLIERFVIPDFPPALVPAPPPPRRSAADTTAAAADSLSSTAADTTAAAAADTSFTASADSTVSDVD